MNRNYPILYFDSDCALCNCFVLWFLKNETERSKHLIKFLPIKSEIANTLIPSHIQKLDTVIFYQDGKFHIYSDVLIYLIPYLKPQWSWISVLKFVPRSIRDMVYRLFAKYRRHILKPLNRCPIIYNAEMQGRLLSS